MQKLVTKYGLAAHLAIMAVAPLFLFPFCESLTIAVSMIWLSAMGATWILIDPSCLHGESLAMARARVVRAILRDPLFWLGLLAVVYCGLCACNGGISLGYDAESGKWIVRRPCCEFLPACADATGFPLFATALTLLVVVQGVAHALGRAARMAFLFTGSLLSALAFVAAVGVVQFGEMKALTVVGCDYTDPAFPGVAFGVWLLAGQVAMFGAVLDRWLKAEPIVALSLLANAAGLCLFAPPAEIAVFGIAFATVAGLTFAVSRGELKGAASLRCTLMMAGALLIPVILSLTALPGSELEAKTKAFVNLELTTEAYHRLRDVLSSFALRIWRGSPWLGAGVGTFPTELRFLAAETDWQVVSPLQTAAVNGWWQLLAERGVLGAAWICGYALLAALPWFLRLWRTRGDFEWQAMNFLGPVALAAVAVTGFRDAAFLRPDVLVAWMAAIAISSSSLPRMRSIE